MAPYRKAEEEAKAAKRGMWVLGEKYVSPRDWRRMKNQLTSDFLYTTGFERF
jgi:endonuclease YncB( thermonuclease family)